MRQDVFCHLVTAGPRPSIMVWRSATLHHLFCWPARAPCQCLHTALSHCALLASSSMQGTLTVPQRLPTVDQYLS